jgi:hypothetical protein
VNEGIRGLDDLNSKASGFWLPLSLCDPDRYGTGQKRCRPRVWCRRWYRSSFALGPSSRITESGSIEGDTSLRQSLLLALGFLPCFRGDCSLPIGFTSSPNGCTCKHACHWDGASLLQEEPPSWQARPSPPQPPFSLLSSQSGSSWMSCDAKALS